MTYSDAQRAPDCLVRHRHKANECVISLFIQQHDYWRNFDHLTTVYSAVLQFVDLFTDFFFWLMQFFDKHLYLKVYISLLSIPVSLWIAVGLKSSLESMGVMQIHKHNSDKWMARARDIRHLLQYTRSQRCFSLLYDTEVLLLLFTSLLMFKLLHKIRNYM